MLPGEFVAIVARDFMKKRERAVEHGTHSLRVLGLGDVRLGFRDKWSACKTADVRA